MEKQPSEAGCVYFLSLYLFISPLSAENKNPFWDTAMCTGGRNFQLRRDTDVYICHWWSASGTPIPSRFSTLGKAREAQVPSRCCKSAARPQHLEDLHFCTYSDAVWNGALDISVLSNPQRTCCECSAWTDAPSDDAPGERSRIFSFFLF